MTGVQTCALPIWVRDDRATTSAEFASIYCLQVVLNLVAVCGYAVYVVVFGAAYRTIALVQLVHVLSICFDVNWFYFGLEQFKVTIARNLVVKVLSLLLIFICVRSARDLWVYALIMAGSRSLKPSSSSTSAGAG